MRTYDTSPLYPLADECNVDAGYDRLVATLPAEGTVAVEGAPTPDWSVFIDGMRKAAADAAVEVLIHDTRNDFPAWGTIVIETADTIIPGDPHLARLPDRTIGDMVDVQPPAPLGAICLIVGPGASTVEADETWYLDTPRRFALGRATTQGSVIGRVEDQEPNFKRMVYHDWPVVEATRRELIHRIDRFVDLTNPELPTHVSGDTLRRSLELITRRPFRTAPHFMPGIWGGTWMQQTWGLHQDQPNLAWSYEMIAPEAGILFHGASDQAEVLEVPLDLLIAAEPVPTLGSAVHATHGFSFPIRFDYLDTVDGQPLSIHCHPTEGYMQDVFGWPYTQHESYYVVDTVPGSTIYLGLRADADVEALEQDCRAADEHGTEFDPGTHINQFQAEKHGLYLIPAGTPHASGAGNLVLEISSTPYFYSLRLYDWLRTDEKGNPRAVHVDHAFKNVRTDRRGSKVEALKCSPSEMSAEVGGNEVELANTELVPFAVNRIEVTTSMTSETSDRFHLLNLVEGDAVNINVADQPTHRLNYGETIVIPAATGSYTIENTSEHPAKVVKAFIR